jgi:hypothetical protein
LLQQGFQRMINTSSCSSSGPTQGQGRHPPPEASHAAVASRSHAPQGSMPSHCELTRAIAQSGPAQIYMCVASVVNPSAMQCCQV